MSYRPAFLPSRKRAATVFTPGGARSAQTEHVLHVVKPHFPAIEETRRPQGARCIGYAALRAHRDLDPLAVADEHHGVLTDDVATTDSVKTDAFRIALAGVALAPVHGTGIQVAAQRRGDHL